MVSGGVVTGPGKGQYCPVGEGRPPFHSTDPTPEAVLGTLCGEPSDGQPLGRQFPGSVVVIHEEMQTRLGVPMGRCVAYPAGKLTG
jgi:hypothetical protein